jgi:GNAT superfamily N-acetyltransferase
VPLVAHVSEAEIRKLDRADVEPHIPMLIADGFTPDIDVGTWFGAFVDGTLAGFVRVFELEGSWMLEDVYVFDEYRRRGIAPELIGRAESGIDHLWLICDDPMIPYYEGLGFSLAPKSDFPEPLAALYTAKKEWPGGSDHNHNAMRWGKAPVTQDKPGRKRPLNAESGT